MDTVCASLNGSRIAGCGVAMARLRLSRWFICTVDALEGGEMTTGRWMFEGFAVLTVIGSSGTLGC